MMAHACHAFPSVGMWQIHSLHPPTACRSDAASQPFSCLAPPRMCDASVFDLPAEPCSAAACGPYSFVTSPWGSCSALCGSDGTASRTVSCLHNGVQVEPTSDEYTQNCLPLGEPFSVRPCFATPCEPYMWRTGAWNNCTSGIQNRTVSCQRVRGGSADASVCFCSDNVTGACTL